MINFKKFNSVISLTSYFTSDDKCKQAIIESHRVLVRSKTLYQKFENYGKKSYFIYP